MPDEWKVTITATLRVAGATTRKEAEKAALRQLLALIGDGVEIPWDIVVVPFRESQSNEPVFGVEWK